MNILNNEQFGYKPSLEFVSKCSQLKDMISSNENENKEVNNIQNTNIEQNTVLNAEQEKKLESLLSQIAIIENKLSDITKPNKNSVSNIELATEYSNPNTDYVITNSSVAGSAITTIYGNSVEMSNVITSANDARLSLKGKDISLNSVKIENNTYDKTKSNYVSSLNNCKYVTIKDCTISPSAAYNGVEIGLSSTQLPKNVCIENCHFGGEFKNNAILIFGTENDAVINITNCTFDSVSNILRISNKTNSRGVVINIKDCVINKWDSNVANQGAIIFEDYTSNKESADIENLFGNGKIVVNITNLMIPDGNGGVVKLDNIMDVTKRLGTKDANQIAYVYQDFGKGFIEFDENKYPIFNIK